MSNADLIARLKRWRDEADDGEAVLLDEVIAALRVVPVSGELRPPMIDALITEYDVAEILNVNVSTLRGWRRRGEGPPYLRLETSIRYDPQDVQRFIDASRRQRPKAGTALAAPEE
jgi:hypothetical protein